MAKLHSPFGFTGTLQGISAYTMQGSAKIILRTAYGPSKKDIDDKPAYGVTRRNIKEFGGRSTAAKWVRKALFPLKSLADYNLSGPLNTLLMPVQQMDRESEWGKRHVQLSLAPHLLEGFNFNRKFAFDASVRNPVNYTLSRESLRATVELPALLPSLTFFPPGSLPYYRIKAVLGVVPNLYYALPRYQPNGNYDQLFAQEQQSEWFATRSGSAALALELHLPYVPENDAFSLMLSVGIEMGTVGATGSLEGIRRVGCGKILAVR